MKLKVLACEIMSRQIAAIAAATPHELDISTLPQHYHDTPLQLRKLLQEELDKIEDSSNSYDAILLGYGLCSNAVQGLHTTKTPLVIPRMHDCITMFLGSSAAYNDAFQRYPGTFFYNYSWMDLAKDQGPAMLERKRAEYMEKYEDEDVVDDLMEMEEMMLANYKGLAYIKWAEFDETPMEEKARQRASEKGWNFYPLQGSSALMQKFLQGDWDPKEFLILSPGQTISPTGDEKIITTVDNLQKDI